MTQNFTENLIDDNVHELHVNFDIEIYTCVPENQHPDNDSNFPETYYKNLKIKYVELVVFGQGVDITAQYLKSFELNPKAKAKIEHQLFEFVTEN